MLREFVVSSAMTDRATAEGPYAVPWPQAYLTLAVGGPAVEAELEVKRSRFRCRLERVEDEAAARAVVETARREHWDARHHCSAFVLGPPPTPVERSSDDGEPSGTAGAPMLEVLRGRHTSDVVAVVTRWFGGVLLGTGGLARAYGGAVSAALDAAFDAGALVRREQRQLAQVSVPVAEVGRIESGLRAGGFQVTRTAYLGLTAHVELAVRPDQVEALTTLVAASTAGRSRAALADLAWVDAGSL